MIPYQSLLFFYVLALALLPAVALGLFGRSLKYYGLLLTVGMLTWIFAVNGQLLMLILFYAWQCALCFLSLKAKQKSRIITVVFIMLAILPLALVKTSEVFPAINFRLLGISYMSFRSVQVLIDIRGGRLKKLSLLDFSYFLLFFPSVSSGPIDRYQRFSADLAETPNREKYTLLMQKGVGKLLFGAFSAIVVSGLLQSHWLSLLAEKGFTSTLSYMYGYTFYLFFNFAGYSSMAIGTAYILGVSLPENFRMPFLSVDMKDFWSRWHITLSTWLRDYLYTPFVMASLKGKWFKKPRTASYIGYILNMMVMGLWHGPSPKYLLYGLYHSILMCLNEILDLHWKPFRKLKQQGLTQVLCVVITFHLFAFGLLIFSGRLF